MPSPLVMSVLLDGITRLWARAYPVRPRRGHDVLGLHLATHGGRTVADTVLAVMDHISRRKIRRVRGRRTNGTNRQHQTDCRRQDASFHGSPSSRWSTRHSQPRNRRRPHQTFWILELLDILANGECAIPAGSGERRSRLFRRRAGWDGHALPVNRVVFRHRLERRSVSAPPAIAVAAPTTSPATARSNCVRSMDPPTPVFGREIGAAVSDTASTG